MAGPGRAIRGSLVSDMALILVRHGPTEWNEAPVELVRGKVDVPLLPKAKALIRATAEQIKARGRPVLSVASDDLSRSKTTAEIIGQTVGAPTYVDCDLEPWDIGKMAGQFKPEIIDTIRYYVENPDKQPPDGEPYMDFYRRWARRFNSGRRMTNGDADIVWVVHSSNFHALPSIIAGGEPEYDEENQPAPASMMVL